VDQKKELQSQLGKRGYSRTGRGKTDKTQGALPEATLEGKRGVKVRNQQASKGAQREKTNSQKESHRQKATIKGETRQRHKRNYLELVGTSSENTRKHFAPQQSRLESPPRGKLCGQGKRIGGNEESEKICWGGGFYSGTRKREPTRSSTGLCFQRRGGKPRAKIKERLKKALRGAEEEKK